MFNVLSKFRQLLSREQCFVLGKYESCTHSLNPMPYTPTLTAENDDFCFYRSWFVDYFSGRNLQSETIDYWTFCRFVILSSHKMCKKINMSVKIFSILESDIVLKQVIELRISGSWLKNYFYLSRDVLQWKWTLCPRHWLLIKRIWRKILFSHEDRDFSPLVILSMSEIQIEIW